MSTLLLALCLPMSMQRYMCIYIDEHVRALFMYGTGIWMVNISGNNLVMFRPQLLNWLWWHYILSLSHIKLLPITGQKRGHVLLEICIHIAQTRYLLHQRTHIVAEFGISVVAHVSCLSHGDWFTIVLASLSFYDPGAAEPFRGGIS